MSLGLTIAPGITPSVAVYWNLSLSIMTARASIWLRLRCIRYIMYVATSPLYIETTY